MNKFCRWTMTFALVTSLVTPSFSTFAANTLKEDTEDPNFKVQVVDGTEELTPAQEAELAKITYKQLIDENSEFNVAVGKALSEGQAALQKKQDAYFNEQVEVKVGNHKEFRTRLQSELAKVEVEIPIQFSASLGSFLDASVEAKRTVQPANASRDQLRIDTLEVEIRNLHAIYAGARVRITFAKRLTKADFPGKNLKEKAVLEDFWWMFDLKNRIPRNSQDVKTKLQIGQTFRLEIDGVIGIKKSKDYETSKQKRNIGVGYTKGATFLMDLARVNGNYTRTRFLGLKNKGSFDVNFGIKKSFMDLLPGALGELLSVGFNFGCQVSDRIFHKYPIDSMMVIYGFNTSKPEGSQALDEIFTNMSKFGFMNIFNPAAEESTLAQKLLAQAPLAEKYAKEDVKAGKVDNFRVKHEFRGRMTSQYYRCGINGNFSRLGNFREGGGGSTTFVRKIDEYDVIQYYLLSNSNQETKGRLASFNLKDRADVDLLVTADRNKNPGTFIDLVTRKEHEEGELDKKELNHLREKISMSLPASLANDPRLQNYLPTDDQDSSSYIIETSFGRPGYQALGKIDRSQLVQNLIEFFEKHPERRQMNLPSDNGKGELDTKPLWQVAEELVYPLYAILNAENNVDADGKATTNMIKEFDILKGQNVFGKWLVSEFLPSQLPNQEAKNLMRFYLSFSSDQSGAVTPVELGTGKPSDIYNSVKFMRRVLDERGFETNLEELQQQKK